MDYKYGPIAKDEFQCNRKYPKEVPHQYYDRWKSHENFDQFMTRFMHYESESCQPKRLDPFTDLQLEEPNFTDLFRAHLRTETGLPDRNTVNYLQTFPPDISKYIDRLWQNNRKYRYTGDQLDKIRQKINEIIIAYPEIQDDNGLMKKVNEILGVHDAVFHVREIVNKNDNLDIPALERVQPYSTNEVMVDRKVVVKVEPDAPTVEPISSNENALAFPEYQQGLVDGKADALSSIIGDNIFGVSGKSKIKLNDIYLTDVEKNRRILFMNDRGNLQYSGLQGATKEVNVQVSYTQASQIPEDRLFTVEKDEGKWFLISLKQQGSAEMP